MIETLGKKILSKPEFKLDNNIPTSYLFRLGITYLIGLIRGEFRRHGLQKSGKKLFIGSKVKLRVKSKINFGNNIRLGNNVYMDALSNEGITLNDNVKIGDNSRIIISGSLSDLGKGLYIGKNTSFSNDTFFGAAGGIKIGSDVIAGQNVRFHAENHNYKDPQTLIRLQGVTRKGITIGNNVWIGAGVVFLDGASIGNNSVVAANAVVQKKFPENSVVGGVPGKVLSNELSKIGE